MRGGGSGADLSVGPGKEGFFLLGKAWVQTVGFLLALRPVGVELPTMWIWGAKRKKLVLQYLNKSRIDEYPHHYIEYVQ